MQGRPRPGSRRYSPLHGLAERPRLCWFPAQNVTPYGRMGCAPAMGITCVQGAGPGGLGDSVLTEGPCPEPRPAPGGVSGPPLCTGASATPVPSFLGSLRPHAHSLSPGASSHPWPSPVAQSRSRGQRPPRWPSGHFASSMPPGQLSVLASPEDEEASSPRNMTFGDVSGPACEGHFWGALLTPPQASSRSPWRISMGEGLRGGKGGWEHLTGSCFHPVSPLVFA